MSGLNAKNVPMVGGNRERPPVLEPGSYPCRLVQVILLGTQAQKPYKGEEKPPVMEIMLTYEFLDEFMKDDEGEDIEDKPRWLSETIPLHNLAADKAKSTQRYYALDPDDKHDGDWAKLIGTPCNVNIVNNEGKGKNAGRTYENIASVSTMRPKEAAKAPELVNPPKVFDYYSPSLEVFESLPDWIKEKMKSALDYEGSDLEAMIEGRGETSKTPKETKKVETEDDSDEEW